MKKRMQLIYFVLSLLILIGCNQKTTPKNYQTIDLMKTITLSIPKEDYFEEDKRIDFSLFNLINQRDTLLIVYLGNNPDYPMLDDLKGKTTEEVKISGMKSQTISLIKNDRRSREVLIALNYDFNNHYPLFAHVFYLNLNNKSAYEIDKIIDSIALSEHYDDKPEWISRHSELTRIDSLRMKLYFKYYGFDIYQDLKIDSLDLSAWYYWKKFENSEKSR